MFHMSWTSKYAGPPLFLFLNQHPARFGLGHYVDREGKRWDVRGIIGGMSGYVQARRLTDAPGYYGTASWDSSNGFHEWLPYKVVLPEQLQGINP